MSHDMPDGLPDGLPGERILALIPHPDDEVVGCCTAIRRMRAAGAEVFGLYLTNGVPAREVLWPWQRDSHARRIARRRAEAEQAAGLLGLMSVGFLDIPSRCLRHHLPAAREFVLAALDHCAADMIWAPAYEGGHQDHDAASFLASTLKGQLPVWEYSEYHYCGGQVNGQGFIRPDGSEQEITPDAAERAFKLRLLAVYGSERGNLGYVRINREVLRPQAAYDYARPPHPGKLFYQRFQWVPFRHPRIDHCRPETVCRTFMESAIL